MWIQSSLSSSRIERILIVIAHPDDESMFFSPIILSAPDKVYILCLSTGDFYGKGKHRVNELQAATESLGIPKNRVKVIDDVGCKDGMSNKWSTSAIYYHVTEYIDLIHPNLVITFDEFGVSGHPNHIDVYKAVKQIRTMHRPQDRETVFLQLNTTNTCRKFLGFFDIILSLMCSEHVVINLNMWSVLTALRLHSTQSVWYRILFVIFSRFTYINSLRKID